MYTTEFKMAAGLQRIDYDYAVYSQHKIATSKIANDIDEQERYYICYLLVKLKPESGKAIQNMYEV